VPLPGQLRPPRPPPPVLPPPSPVTPVAPRRDQPKAPRSMPDTPNLESDKPLAPLDGIDDGAPEIGFHAPAPAVAPPAPPPRTLAPLVRPVGAAGNRYAKLAYPPAAERKGLQGTVVVMFDVLEDGSVTNARIVSGPAEFHRSVLQVAATWRFAPAMRAGQAVRYTGMTKRVVFVLEGNE
jgi:protein TonB